jgi:hypothetical protein
MEQNEILRAIQQDISELKKNLAPPLHTNCVSSKWVPRPDVMRFFNYAPTQMASLEKSGEVTVAKVGKRKFYLRESLENFLEKNIQPRQNP